jgi:caffeoyl-CoA O-methyltransferase
MADMERFIDVVVEQFARDHTEPETDLYVRLREETYREMKSPEMQVDAIEGRFLKMLVRLTGAQPFSNSECSPDTVHL